MDDICGMPIVDCEYKPRLLINLRNVCCYFIAILANTRCMDFGFIVRGTLVKQGNLDILHQRKNFVEDVSGTYSQSGMLVTTERNSYENSKYCI